MRYLILLSFFFFAGIGLAQEPLKAPFYIEAMVKEGANDSSKTVQIKIKNQSFNTYYLSCNPSGASYKEDSVCLVSLNYTNRYALFLCVPNFDLDFMVLKPFKTISFNKTKESNEISRVDIDFDFIAKKKLSKKNSVLVKKDTTRDMAKIKLVDFYTEIYLYNQEARMVSYELILE